jgi:hypothetical protein
MTNEEGMDRVTEMGPADSAVAATASMEKPTWQGRSPAERPRRLDLLRLRPSWLLRPVSIRVHRNQPFEFAASDMRPFLEFAGLEPGFDYGPYDDALGLEVPWTALQETRTACAAVVEITWREV